MGRIQQVREGDRGALRALFSEHIQNIYTRAKEHLGEEAAAKDALKQTLMLAQERCADCPEDALPWLCSLCDEVLGIAPEEPACAEAPAEELPEEPIPEEASVEEPAEEPIPEEAPAEVPAEEISEETPACEEDSAEEVAEEAPACEEPTDASCIEEEPAEDVICEEALPCEASAEECPITAVPVEIPAEEGETAVENAEEPVEEPEENPQEAPEASSEETVEETDDESVIVPTRITDEDAGTVSCVRRVEMPTPKYDMEQDEWLMNLRREKRRALREEAEPIPEVVEIPEEQPTAVENPVETEDFFPDKKPKVGIFGRICIILLAVVILILAWALLGLLMNLEYLPFKDLGYSWFNTHIMNMF